MVFQLPRMYISWGLMDRERDFENHFCLAGMFMVEASREAALRSCGEGKKEEVSQSQNPGGSLFSGSKEVAEHIVAQPLG